MERDWALRWFVSLAKNLAGRYPVTLKNTPKCIWCGDPIPRGLEGAKYCSDECGQADHFKSDFGKYQPEADKVGKKGCLLLLVIGGILVLAIGMLILTTKIK
jgi:hypothetical protein